ncbi:conjugal transfer protein TraX [Escherichia coli]|nr:conjugal transfer protein TraX [Escherichia coli]
MKLSMKSLAALLMMLNGAVMASENVNTPENRQFLKQQENLSRQLREKPDHQLKAWAEKQVLENPLQRSDNHFLDELVRKQQASQDGKPRQGALYFVSFSIPEEGLKRMLGETRHYGIPATLRGMVNNDLKTTAEAVLWGLNLSRHTHIRQVAINRLWGWAVFSQFWYYFAGFPWYEGNILFAFAVAAQVLTWCETRSGWRTAAAILLIALWGPLSGSSYGIAGLLMLAVSHRLYRAEDRAERLALVACLLAVIPALNLATSDAAAVAGLVMTVLTVGLVSCAGKSLPRFWPGDFFPVFYACHLAVLGVLAP